MSEEFSSTIDVGTGQPAVVLVHGFCCQPSDFQWHIDALSKSYRVIAPTLRGHSDDGSTPDQLGIEDLAADIARCLSSLDLGDVILCGHSLGTRVVLELSTLLPDRLRGIILLDGSRAPAGDLEEQLDTFDEATRGVKIKLWVHQLFDGMFLPGTFNDLQADFRQRIDDMDDRKQAAIARGMIVWDQLHFNNRVQSTSNVPMLVLQSTDRPAGAPRRSLTPGETGLYPGEVLAHRPDAQVTTYTDCGHFPNFDEPKRLLQDLNRWIESL